MTWIPQNIQTETGYLMCMECRSLIENVMLEKLERLEGPDQRADCPVCTLLRKLAEDGAQL